MSVRTPQHKYIAQSESRKERSQRLRSDNFYQHMKEVCPKMAEEVYHQNQHGAISTSTKVPNKHGIENSEPIIPSYYLSGQNLDGRLFECDFHYSILDSIRNIRVLSKYQMQFVEELNWEDCQEIIREYNKAMVFVVNYINIVENES
jgi:hypothetical protein